MTCSLVHVHYSSPSSAPVAACTVDVQVQEHEAGGSSQCAGLESQGGDINDVDHTKCMPCSVM